MKKNDKNITSTVPSPLERVRERIRLKVCGMKYKDNIEQVAALQPDYLGFIFYEKSARYFDSKNIPKLPKSIKKVGVFVNEEIDKVLSIVKENKLEAVQLHGNESPEYCKQLKILVAECSKSDNNNNVISTPLNHQIEIFKAFSVDDNFEFSKTEAYQKVCDYLLFDTKGKEYGGNGIKFNWQVLDNYKGALPFLLSGGISKVDALAINEISHKAFAGVDINSGFEIEPALKNIANIKEFKQNLS
jgi:phosphoribosylanthranilate isomerase